MDLGCIDMGCISVSDKKLDSENKGNDSVSESVSTTSKIGQNKQMKENGQTTLNSVNKSTAQIKKPGHRRNSPINWFPRKKVDSYLKKKIQMLQEVSGMNSTLDETLGDSNPHYSKVLKEKMASREAALKAIEARKAALVEASWCRILKAARIIRKEAEEQLLKAEDTAAEAFKAALAIGVNMYDIPNCPQKPHHNHNAEKSSSSSNHGVTACFETAFEVDKEVAASVKSALIRLANNGSSFQRDEFKDLLRKISQNPETEEEEEEQRRSLDSSSSSSSPPKCETKKSPEKPTPVSQRSRRKGRGKKRQSLERRLVDTMLFERLQSLKEDEISSLATIVATCGLSAALAEVKNERLEEEKNNNNKPITEPEPLLPSLDKVLVRHVSRLEREVEEAKKKKKNPETKSSGQNPKQDGSEIPSLEKFLVKRESRLEREVQEAKDRRRRRHNDESAEGKENRVDPNTAKKKNETEEECESLDKVLVKHVSRLEREKMRFAGSEESEYTNSKKKKKSEQESEEGFEGLDQILVKHKSRLEREKFVSLLSSRQQEEDKNKNNKSVVMSRREERERELQQAWGDLGLGNSMNKPHLSKLERDKAAWIKAEEEERKQAMVFSD